MSIQLKSILYVSTSTSRVKHSAIPAGIASILRHSVRANRINGIQGFISYSEGRYLQMIVGPEQAIEQLYESICADSRHTDVTLIINESLSNYFVRNTYMKLVSDLNSEPICRTYFSRFSQLINQLDRDKKRLLAHFLDLDKLPSTNSSPSNQFKNKKDVLLSLHQWPALDSISDNPFLVELSALLVDKAYYYDEILMLVYGCTDVELDKALENFDALGLLNRQETENKFTARKPIRTPWANIFYSKMKNALLFRKGYR